MSSNNSQLSMAQLADLIRHNSDTVLSRRHQSQQLTEQADRLQNRYSQMPQEIREQIADLRRQASLMQDRAREAQAELDYNKRELAERSGVRQPSNEHQRKIEAARRTRDYGALTQSHDKGRGDEGD